MRSTLLRLTIVVSLILNYTFNANTQNVVYQSSINSHLSSPIKMAIDNFNNIYVTDGYQKCVNKYDLSGNFIEKIIVGDNPISIAINQNNEIFIGDGTNGIITKINNNGSQSVFYNGLALPTSMTFSPEGLLYVADGKMQNVIVLDVSANLVQTIGQGTLIFPTSVVYDKANSRILVSEHGGIGSGMNPTCKIWVFNLLGNLQTSFASNGSGDGQFYRIQGMAIGKCGNLFVCDPFQGNISIFNENNVFITRFGLFGIQPGNLNIPLDILFDSQERAIVASMNNGALEVFNLNDSLPTSNIFNSDATICSNQTANININFTGTAPWTFTYTINGINPNTITTSDNPFVLQTNQSGLYEVTALSDLTKIGTCFSGSAKIIVNNTIPTSTISAGNITTCAGSSINIPIQFTGTSPWTFTYTKDGLTPTTITTANNPYNLSATEAGLYEITAITAGGCAGNTFVGNANITLNTLPTATLVNGNTPISICQGETALLPVELIGTSPWTISYTINTENLITYTTSNNYFNIEAIASGNYNIISISDANCAGNILNSSTEVIIKPTPSSIMASINTSVCQGNITEIPISFSGLSPFNFTYSINDSIFYNVTTNNHEYVLQVNEAGNYQIVNLIGNGCEGNNNIGIAQVNLNALPTSIFTDGNNQVNICEGQHVNLPLNFTGVAPYTFTYTINNVEQAPITTSDNPYLLNTSLSGVFEVQTISDAMCVNLSTLGTPEVVITPLPTVKMDNPTAYICNGLNSSISISLTGISPWTFTYTVNGSNPTNITALNNQYQLLASNSGLYEITNISTNGCNGIEIIGNTNVTEGALAIPLFTYNNNGLELSFTNNSQNATSYYWNFGDELTSTEINPTHLYIAPNIYTVTLIASNGICADSASSQTIDLLPLSLNNTNTNNSISVYPNPSNGQIIVNLSDKNTTSWSFVITNSIGQVVLFNNYTNSLEQINLKDISSGIYTVKIVSEKTSKTEKLIINR